MAMQLVGEQEVAQPPSAAQITAGAAMGVILQALRVLSQRTVLAIASLIDLALCASVFYLVLNANSTEYTNPLQIWTVGGYAAFVLVVLLFRRRG